MKLKHRKCVDMVFIYEDVLRKILYKYSYNHKINKRLPWTDCLNKVRTGLMD